jgi:hypothetical protein
MVVLMFANHTYGATSKLQPEGFGAGCPRLIGCCARAPDVTPVAIIIVRAAAMRIRFNIKNSFASIYRSYAPEAAPNVKSGIKAGSQNEKQSEDEGDLRADLPGRAEFRTHRVVVRFESEVDWQLAADLHDTDNWTANQHGPGNGWLWAFGLVVQIPTLSDRSQRVRSSLAAATAARSAAGSAE